LSSPISAHPKRAPEAAPAIQTSWDFIAFETKGWGVPITSWRILPNGGGSWTETVRAKDAAWSDYRLSWYEFEPDAFAYTQLVAILNGLPTSAPDSRKCANFMPDMPYGTIRLTKGATTTEIAWNSGCLDPDYQKFIETLKKADMLVAGRGRAGKFLREEKPQ
jgi:hypothetical protein